MANYINTFLLNRHVFVFNPEDGNEGGLTIMTEYYLNDNNEIFVDQEITLQSSQGSSATFMFPGFMTPQALRALADQLEKVHAETVEIANASIDKPH